MIKPKPKVCIPELGRKGYAKRKTTFSPVTGRPISLMDIDVAVRVSTYAASHFESRGLLFPRFATFKDYCTAIGLDVDAVLREHETVRHFYADQIPTQERKAS